MPDVTTQLNVTVKTPNGTQTIANPLAAFRFRPIPTTSELPPAGDFLVSRLPMLLSDERLD